MNRKVKVIVTTLIIIKIAMFGYVLYKRKKEKNTPSQSIEIEE